MRVYVTSSLSTTDSEVNGLCFDGIISNKSEDTNDSLRAHLGGIRRLLIQLVSVAVASIIGQVIHCSNKSLCLFSCSYREDLGIVIMGSCLQLCDTIKCNLEHISDWINRTGQLCGKCSKEILCPSSLLIIW